MKRIFSVLAVLILFFAIAPFKEASAQEVTSQSQLNSSNTEQSSTPTTVTHETYGISPQKANVTLDIEARSTGGILGLWNYRNPGKVVTFVALKMDLEYRENFLHPWTTVDSVDFIYPGGLGEIAQDEHTFYPKAKGQYRLYLSGDVSFGTGGNHIILYSGARAYDGKIIISNDPDKLELK
jgi:hypothetical protein